MKTNKIKEEQICMCGHRIDDHLEQVNGKAKAGECSLCKCYYYCEDNSIQTKCKGETYEESNKRNNYFFEEGKIEGVKQATADFINDEIKFLEELEKKKIGISAGIKLQIQVRLEEIKKQMLVEK